MANDPGNLIIDDAARSVASKPNITADTEEQACMPHLLGERSQVAVARILTWMSQLMSQRNTLKMTNVNVLEADLSLCSRPTVAGFIPILRTIDGLNHVPAEIEIDMAMGENWLIRQQLVTVYLKIIVERFTAQI